MGKEAPATDSISPQATNIPLAPPNYSEAATSSTPPTHHFKRRSRFSSKVFVQSDGVDKYCFAAGKEAKVWIYAGASTSNTPLGYLTFPKSHNAIRLYFGAVDDGAPGPDGVDANGMAFSDVKARVGIPHASSFSFKGGASGAMKEYEWTKWGSSGADARVVQYDLSVSGLEVIATLTVDSVGTRVSWRRAPANELEQAFLILSAIGVITRLSKKGMYRDADLAEGQTGQRWFSFWWMAALSSAAIM